MTLMLIFFKPILTDVLKSDWHSFFIYPPFATLFYCFPFYIDSILPLTQPGFLFHSRSLCQYLFFAVNSLLLLILNWNLKDILPDIQCGEFQLNDDTTLK